MNPSDFKIFRADKSHLDAFVHLQTLLKNDSYYVGNEINQFEYAKCFKSKKIHVYGVTYENVLISSAIVKLHKEKKSHLKSLCMNFKPYNIAIARCMLSGIENELANMDFINFYVDIKIDDKAAYTCFAERAYFKLESQALTIRLQKLLNIKPIMNMKASASNIKAVIERRTLFEGISVNDAIKGDIII